jgi:hypothetical protein
MNQDGLLALQDALSGSLGPHLDDEMISELATVEAAGEDIEALYPDQVKHLEVCAQCATEYSELVDMMLVAVGDSVVAVSPQEQFVQLLRTDFDQKDIHMPGFSSVLDQLVSYLPLSFVTQPVSVKEIQSGMVEQIARQSAVPEKQFQEFITVVIQSLEKHFSALKAFLMGRAENIWGQPLGTNSQRSDMGAVLQLFPTAKATVPILSTQLSEEKWALLSQRVGDPIPFHVGVWAERTSPLACDLNIQIDRPGLDNAAGRSVQLRYGYHIRSTQTSSSGIARFADIPIAAIPNIEISFRDD